MKASEITLGQDYAYGTKGRWKTYRQARVLEIGKHQVIEGSDAEVPAALIRFKDGTQQWVVLRSILMPWSDHADAQARAAQAWEAQPHKSSENAERARNAVKGLAEIGFDTGTEPFELVGEHAVASGFVRVKVEFLEEALEALTELEVG
jgi:hypothetical protein